MSGLKLHLNPPHALNSLGIHCAVFHLQGTPVRGYCAPKKSSIKKPHDSNRDIAKLAALP